MALKLLPTGDLIDAAEAHRIRLIQQLVPDDQLQSTVRELAERIAASGEKRSPRFEGR